MSETIPIAPDAPKVQGGGESFDEEVLTEIEKRLDLEGGEQAGTKAVGEKVELDKADLPLDLGQPEEAEAEAEPKAGPPPQVEVDLSDVELDRGALQEEAPAPSDRRKKVKLIGLGMLLLTVGVGAALGVWYGMVKPSEKVEEEMPPYFFRGPVPDPEAALRLKLEPFIVPLMKSAAGRILRVVVDLEVTEPKNKESVADRTRMVRDVIYRLLRNRPAMELRSARSKKLLQAQIKTEINHSLEKPLVFKVFFTEFVITG